MSLGRDLSTIAAPHFPKIEIQYAINDRIEHAKRAPMRIRELFTQHAVPAASKSMNEIDILVVCAGSFPGFVPFTNELMQHYPHLKTINYTFVDPSEHGPLLFFKHLYPEEIDMLDRKVKTNFIMHTATLMGYLRDNNDKFSLVLLEHPYVGLYAQLYDGAHLFNYTPMTVLSALPHLAKNLNLNATVMVVCKNSEEESQLQEALDFSLDMQSKVLTKSSAKVSSPEDYATAIAGQYKQKLFSPTKAERRERQIMWDQKSLSVLVGLSIGLCIYSIQNGDMQFEALASAFSLLVYISSHSAGTGRSLGIKLATVTLQACAVAFAAHEAPLKSVNSFGPK
jgi:hypothetical protein